MRRILRWLNGQDTSKNCWVLPGPPSWALPEGDLADSKAPHAGGEYYFTCLSLKSQAVEKRRRDQHGDPPGKGTKG